MKRKGKTIPIRNRKRELKSTQIQSSNVPDGAVILSDDAILRLSQPTLRKQAYFKGARPSNFCHICGRKANEELRAICSNVVEGVCRKIICDRCFDKYRFDGKTISEIGDGWTCTHCREVCPRRCQCTNYTKTNGKIRLTRLKANPVIAKIRKSRGDDISAISSLFDMLQKLVPRPILLPLMRERLSAIENIENNESEQSTPSTRDSSLKIGALKTAESNGSGFDMIEEKESNNLDDIDVREVYTKRTVKTSNFTGSASSDIPRASSTIGAALESAQTVGADDRSDHLVHESGTGGAKINAIYSREKDCFPMGRSSNNYMRISSGEISNASSGICQSTEKTIKEKTEQCSTNLSILSTENRDISPNNDNAMPNTKTASSVHPSSSYFSSLPNAQPNDMNEHYSNVVVTPSSNLVLNQNNSSNNSGESPRDWENCRICVSQTHNTFPRQNGSLVGEASQNNFSEATHDEIYSTHIPDPLEFSFDLGLPKVDEIGSINDEVLQ